MLNEIGLHARPAALVVELAARHESDLRLAKAAGGAAVSARSLTGLMTLGARLGDELLATPSGPDAREAIDALEELARGGFGEGVAAAGTERASEPAPAEEDAAREDAAEPEPGAVLERDRRVSGSRARARPPPWRGAGGAARARGRGARVRAPAARAGRESARAAIEADRERVAARGAVAEAEIFAAHLALLDDEALLEPAPRGDRRRAPPPSGAWLDAVRRGGRDLPRPRRAAAARARRRRGRRRPARRRGDHGARMRPRGPPRRASSSPTSSPPARPPALDPALVRGVATARGTPTAHAAILARALGLPAVVGLGGRLLAVPEGTPLAPRRRRGLGPGRTPGGAARGGPRARRGRPPSGARPRANTRSSPRRRATARAIEVAANVDDPEAAAAAVELGAEGVGLLRTEFMFLDRPSLPSEDEQAEHARRDRAGARRAPADRADARRRRGQAAAGAADGRPRRTRSWAGAASGCRWRGRSCWPRSCARSCGWPPSTR